MASGYNAVRFKTCREESIKPPATSTAESRSLLASSQKRHQARLGGVHPQPKKKNKGFSRYLNTSSAHRLPFGTDGTTEDANTHTQIHTSEKRRQQRTTSSTSQYRQYQGQLCAAKKAGVVLLVLLESSAATPTGMDGLPHPQPRGGVNRL